MTFAEYRAYVTHLMEQLRADREFQFRQDKKVN